SGDQVIVLVFVPFSPGRDVYLTYLNAARLQAENRPDAANREFGAVVLHDVTKDNLRHACKKLLNGTFDENAWDDLHQAAIVRLLESHTAGTLRYQDRGPEAFSGWWWIICRRACVKVLLGDRKTADVACVAPERLAETVKSGAPRSLGEELLRA